MFKSYKFFIKIFAILIVVIFLLYLASRGHVYESEELAYGITFSKKQAQSLGFDWQKMYLSIFDDLGVKKLRLPAYWNEIEWSDGDYHWDDLDWQVNEASSRGVEIIVAVGGRLPRWPECHFPDWTEGFNKGKVQTKILEYIKLVLERYKDNKNIMAWQVENEPFLSHFGDCPKLDKEFLEEEIALVHSLDNRPVVITDSGELSLWVSAAKRADIFGTTMYLDTYSKNFGWYVHYPISPAFFRFKKNITNLFAQPEKWIVIELQAEPWGPIQYQDMSQEERSRTMDLNKLKDIIEFAHQTGFQEFYLWGVEWWYWEKEQGRPEVWDYAKSLFNK